MLYSVNKESKRPPTPKSTPPTNEKYAKLEAEALYRALEANSKRKGPELGRPVSWRTAIVHLFS